MSVIIRLQNLPWSANALDIRQYFQGLSIPEGGVHIVGGEQGDAFIAFSTDEDARQAMLTDGGKIKEVKVKLMLSSRTEMQKVIEQARQQSVSLQTLLQMPAPPIIAPVIAPAAPPPVPAPVPVSPVVAPPPPPVVTPTVPPVVTILDTVVKQSERRDSKEKRDRRDRSRSRDRGRRDRDRRRRDRSRSRDRRRRRSRDRSRDRSKDRDRNKESERRRVSRDSHSSRDSRRTSLTKDERNVGEQNGGDVKRSSSVWEVPPSASVALPAKPMPAFPKTPIIATPPARPVGPPLADRAQPEIPLPRGDMDGRRIMGSGPFPAPGSRPLGTMGTEATTSPFQPSNWQPVGRFPFQQQSFNEGNDFDFRASNNFRGGGFRGRGDGRSVFNPRMGMPIGPSNILKPPGVMGPNSFPRMNSMENTFTPQSRFEPYANRNFRPNYDPRATLAGSCVEIRNMPLDVGYSELRKFFQGLYVSNNAIKMINDNKGYRIGMAYMRFANPEAKDRAINHTGKTIRGSVIEVLHVDDDIFDKAIDNFRPDVDLVSEKRNESPQEDTSCLFIQDLPPYAKESDVYKLFPDMTVSDVVLMNKDKQYVAYVKFLRPEEAKKALYVSLKPTIGHKAVSLSLCTKQLFIQAKLVLEAGKKPVSLNGSPAKEPPKSSDDVSIVETRSKPEQVSSCESRSQASADLARVRPEERSDPRNRSGEAAEPRETAMEVADGKAAESGDPRTSDPRGQSALLDHRSRPMEVLDHRGRPMEMPDHRGRPMEMPDHRGRPMEMPDHRGRPMEMQQDHRGLLDHRARPMEMPDHRGGLIRQAECVLLKGLPFLAKDRDILDFFSDVGLVPMRIHLMLDGYQKPTGDAYCEFQTPEEVMRATAKNNTMLGKHEVLVQPVMRAKMNEMLGFGPPEMEMCPPPLRNNFPPMGRFPPNRTLLGNPPRMPLLGGRGPMGLLMGPPKDAAHTTPLVEGFGKPGCVLALENIPFRVEVEEILEYFRGFEVTRENIIRRFNDQGMATGDARVSFATPAEAQRAARELRGGKIRNRPIYVNLV